MALDTGNVSTCLSCCRVKSGYYSHLYHRICCVFRKRIRINIEQLEKYVDSRNVYGRLVHTIMRGKLAVSHYSDVNSTLRLPKSREHNDKNSVDQHNWVEERAIRDKQTPKV